MTTATSLEDIFALASRLSATEKALLIERLARELASMSAPARNETFVGSCSDLGAAPSAADIAAAREDMLGSKQ